MHQRGATAQGPRRRLPPLLAAWTLLCGSGCLAPGLKPATETVFLQPPYVTHLDSLLAREGRRTRQRYNYRCTRGAHRGASGIHRENSLAALAAAEADDRFAFVEFDVQYSEDLRIVVFHDQRMLRLFGSLRSIGHTDFATLREVTDGEITSFNDALDVLGKPLNIEIKSQGDALEDERLVDEVVAELRRRQRSGEVLLSSISRDVVRYIHRTYPDIPSGEVFWLTASTYLHLERLTEALYDDLRTSPAEYLILHVANLRNIEDLLRLKPPGKTIMFWDFDDEMYLVHKDVSDRLWSESGPRAALGWLRYRLAP